VVTDDQRPANTMRVMPKTLAAFANGTRFSNAFAVTPPCCPSRATILSGGYAHNAGVKSQAPGPLDQTTLFPRCYRRAGTDRNRGEVPERMVADAHAAVLRPMGDDLPVQLGAPHLQRRR